MVRIVVVASGKFSGMGKTAYIHEAANALDMGPGSNKFARVSLNGCVSHNSLLMQLERCLDSVQDSKSRFLHINLGSDLEEETDGDVSNTLFNLLILRNVSRSGKIRWLNDDDVVYIEISQPLRGKRNLFESIEMLELLPRVSMSTPLDFVTTSKGPIKEDNLLIVVKCVSFFICLFVFLFVLFVCFFKKKIFF